jgi:16S rRNA (guanine966-N2)-methyltransferase
MLTSRLGGFTDLAVADLFAGSGALGLEAMSRGAASCLFVDSDREAIAAIRANVASLAAERADIRQSSALNPTTVAKPFDLIFLDPPYAQEGIGALLDQLIGRGWIASGTTISIETGHGDQPECPALSHQVSRKVGKAELHLFRMD